MEDSHSEREIVTGGGWKEGTGLKKKQGKEERAGMAIRCNKRAG